MDRTQHRLSVEDQTKPTCVCLHEASNTRVHYTISQFSRHDRRADCNTQPTNTNVSVLLINSREKDPSLCYCCWLKKKKKRTQGGSFASSLLLPLLLCWQILSLYQTHLRRPDKTASSSRRDDVLQAFSLLWYTKIITAEPMTLDADHLIKVFVGDKDHCPNVEKCAFICKSINKESTW